MPPYKNLLSYRYAVIIFDLTSDFLRKFLPEIEQRRTREQMTQAARSGKQNIVEGSGRDLTSKKSEITLLDVARMSFEELTEDYEDFLRQHRLRIWAKTEPKVAQIRQRAFKLTDSSNIDTKGDFKVAPQLPTDPELAANILLTLCHQASYLVFQQLKSVENKIITQGGYTENLTRRRNDYLRNLK